MIRISLIALQKASALRPPGYFEDIISRGKIEGNELMMDESDYALLRRKYGNRKTAKPQYNIGAGTELKKLIAKFGFKPKAGCKCAQHIREMNQNGIDWCSQNIDTIVGWLREEAVRAKLPFTEVGAKMMIKIAIRQAKKTIK